MVIAGMDYIGKWHLAGVPRDQYLLINKKAEGIL
jgi:hypothetical protein